MWTQSTILQEHETHIFYLLWRCETIFITQFHFTIFRCSNDDRVNNVHWTFTKFFYFFTISFIFYQQERNLTRKPNHNRTNAPILQQSPFFELPQLSFINESSMNLSTNWPLVWFYSLIILKWIIWFHFINYISFDSIFLKFNYFFLLIMNCRHLYWFHHHYYWFLLSIWNNLAFEVIYLVFCLRILCIDYFWSEILLIDVQQLHWPTGIHTTLAMAELIHFESVHPVLE